ncbi:hypothetical protein [Pseudomonas amygdali]|uniref:hypothetical protein n=1 Tax=Pseudomonas amygdali TaxID=47877 RepID=UPI001FB84805|nr:hypothetical protein [Pseudomonas amygdali]UPT38875.1 hypothetical protein LT107_09890 [Pseudomonas amygdali pv. loropetali]
MNSTHQEMILQILTTVMKINAQGKLLGFFDYSGHVQMVSAHFYVVDAFDDLNSPREALHVCRAWLNRNSHVLNSPDDSGEEPISLGLNGMLELVLSLLQPTEQSEREQAA